MKIIFTGLVSIMFSGCFILPFNLSVDVNIGKTKYTKEEKLNNEIKGENYLKTADVVASDDMHAIKYSFIEHASQDRTQLYGYGLIFGMNSKHYITNKDSISIDHSVVGMLRNNLDSDSLDKYTKDGGHSSVSFEYMHAFSFQDIYSLQSPIKSLGLDDVVLSLGARYTLISGSFFHRPNKFGRAYSEDIIDGVASINFIKDNTLLSAEFRGIPGEFFFKASVQHILEQQIRLKADYIYNSILNAGVIVPKVAFVLKSGNIIELSRTIRPDDDKIIFAFNFVDIR